MAINTNELIKAVQKKEDIDGIDLCDIESEFYADEFMNYTDEELREEYGHIKVLYDDEHVNKSVLHNIVDLLATVIREECLRRMLGDKIPVGIRYQD